MSYPAPTRDHHHQFCVTEQWSLVRDARGKAVAHHLTFELTLFDGRILRTRISRPPDRTTYGKSIWSAILLDQLVVDPPAFWACVQDGKVPDRPGPARHPEGLPLSLVNTLKSTLGLTETDIAGLTKESALERLNLFWAAGP